MEGTEPDGHTDEPALTSEELNYLEKWGWFVTLKNIAHDWLKVKESEVLKMTLEEVLIECRMMKDHHQAQKAFFDKQKLLHEKQNPSLRL